MTKKNKTKDINTEKDKEYMLMAISLARKGGGYVLPNPRVGAVIVKDGEVIGEGYHQRYGELHAERNALASCPVSPEGGTCYVTLEPCCHHGKTPPCTDALIEAGIRKVVIGSRDPNPLVAGKGAETLRSAGIEVVRDFLKDECDALNAPFFKHMEKGFPYVTMKYAMTMDGKIATYTGASRWITGEGSRQDTHMDRSENMAIMVGVGTVIADDPSLTVRHVEGLDPVRVICDTDLRTPMDCRLVQSAQDSSPLARQPRTIIATCESDTTRHSGFLARGVKIIVTERDENGKVDLKDLMKKLGEMDIDSLIVEGGGSLNWSALSSGIVDKVKAYIAPRIFGGEEAPGPVRGPGVPLPSEGYMLKDPVIRKIGEDHLIESEVVICSQE